MNIEKLIQENRNSFDSDEPQALHFEKFDQKLGNRLHSKKKRQPSFFLKVAAIFALGLMSTLWLYEKFIQAPVNNSFAQMSLSDISPEYAEVEFYYTNSINSSLEDLSPYLEEHHELKQELLDKEFEQLDSLYLDLQKELTENPGNEQIIDAMIQHYQTKMEIIATVLKQLKKVKTHKAQNNERTEI